MAEKRVCMGCEDDSEETHMFQGVFLNDNSEGVEEVYCNLCLANILTEEPEMISQVEAI